MPNNQPRPEIDLSKIKYPSDRVTLKQLRTLAEDDLGLYFKQEGTDIGNMTIREQNHAKLGFAKALGDPAMIEKAIFDLVGDHWDEEQDGKYSDAKGLGKAVEMLTEYYIRYGVAEGPISAKQAIRRIEKQGAEQAKQFMGRTGGD
ncbi:MAG: hypothetical protein KatS3mg108_0735 [Isosphaeraceae bacterium]|nr:MAG: hypothetical protein KatS3mg108_0735 [Isosphaeraceae bacterium]